MNAAKLGVYCNCEKEGNIVDVFITEAHELMIVATCDACKTCFHTAFNLPQLDSQCPEVDSMEDQQFFKQSRIVPF